MKVIHMMFETRMVTIIDSSSCDRNRYRLSLPRILYILIYVPLRDRDGRSLCFRVFAKNRFSIVKRPESLEAMINQDPSCCDDNKNDTKCYRNNVNFILY